MIIFNAAYSSLSGAAPWTLAPFTVGSKPVYFYAYGLTEGDKICVRRTVTSADMAGYTSNGCTITAPVAGQVMARQTVDTCGDPLCMELGRSSLQVLEPGSYELVGEGPGFTAGTVVIEQTVWTGEHSPVTCAKPTVVHSQIICGQLTYIWSDGSTTVDPTPVEECEVEVPFCASIPLNGGGFGYHEFDVRDPAATVIIAPCAGDTSVDTIYIYPTAGPGHTARQSDCEGNLIGYGANQSACAITPSTAPSCA